MEKIRDVLERASPLADAIILNPGAMEKNADLLGGKSLAAGLVKADWTNAHRPSDFALPVQKIHRVLLSDAEDALLLGALGVVATLLMGFEDEFEADNIESVSHLARSCYEASLPLLIDVLPAGPKVTPVNHDDVVKLAVSFMMEAGADAIIVPPVGDEARKLLGSWCTVPLLERREDFPTADELEKLTAAGYRGVVVTEEAMTTGDWEQRLRNLARAVGHGQGRGE